MPPRSDAPIRHRLLIPLTVLVIAMIVAACRGGSGADRARATAALLTPEDVGSAWSISIGYLVVDDYRDGPKGIDAICPYDVRSDNRFFVLDEPQTHFWQVVYVMNPSRVETCLDQLRNEPAYRERTGRPDLLPEGCPRGSFVYGSTAANSSYDDFRAFIHGAGGLLSVLLLSGPPPSDSWTAVLRAACARLATVPA
jgi:hypothetical protein